MSPESEPPDTYGEGHGIDIVQANDYVNRLARDEDQLLMDIRKYCRQFDLPNINPEEGRVLSMLVQVSGAKRALEVGTCTGYSGIWIARALPAGGTLETIEFNASNARVARDNFKKANVADRVKVLEGKALDIMPTLEEGGYDLVFIDADKQEYSDYLEQALRLSHKGSLICADNMYWQGKVFEGDVDDDTEAIKYYQKRIFSNQRLRSTVLPVSDGLSISLVRS